MAIEHNEAAAFARKDHCDAEHDAYRALIDDAVEIIERGGDVAPHCDQESLKERLSENEAFWTAVHQASLAHNIAERENGQADLKRIAYDEASGMCQEYAQAVMAGRKEAA
ncbi:hypothetical protein [Chromohalobacter sp. 296-RDG]|uniref:hypothetical protein n=1 Tax=Chromohalobacter sp. 296-RDG TaxID=2994062 RepID=UPI0024683A9E|nr:hypothetical protein [Chromohalobacter sp. 296-RDG]